MKIEPIFRKELDRNLREQEMMAWKRVFQEHKEWLIKPNMTPEEFEKVINKAYENLESR
jgi:hypothetical protein